MASVGDESELVRSAVQIVADRSASSAALPRVLSEVPVAVLLIDRVAGTVTYANEPAVHLAGDLRLPVPIDRWGEAARLTDLGGEPLASSAGPLSRVAGGEPVSGEAVRIPAEGPQEPDRILWVTGFPLSRTDAAEQLALVVFLEVTPAPGGVDDPEVALAALRDRAVIATDLAFTISDPLQPDNPLVWVNPSFTRVTGYSMEEVLGRNCRFLQGPATDPAAVAELRAAVMQQRPATVTILNYRRDGTAFWNQVSISPVFDGEGTLVSFVGVQSDVTERVEVEAERSAAYAAERAAREEAELSHQRLALLAEAATFLNGTLDADEALDRLARLVVPQLADWTAIHVLSEDGNLRDVAYRHRDGLTEAMQRYAQIQPGAMTKDSPVSRVLTDGAPLLVKQLRRSVVEAATTSDELGEIVEQLGICSLMVVPLVARRRVIGTMALVSGASGRVFDNADLEVAADLARRAGLALDNARLYEREHRAAEVLQRSLLPDVPPLDGVEVAVRYIAGSRQAEVGGDFYELLDLPDRAIGLAVGDVVGHDLAAAAAMGHLRGLLRACAWDTVAGDDGNPGRVLERVDRLVQGLHVAPLATVFYGRLDRPAVPGADWHLTYASAGHPPPLLRRPDGSVSLLEDAGGLILGVGEGVPRTSATIAVPSASLLLAYTDGLIERRGRDIDEGLSWLQEVTAASDASPESLVQMLTEAVGQDLEDDLAVLAVRLS